MSTKQYPKIDTLYDRGGDHKVDTGRIRRPEFVIPCGWLVTEKIHGCNIRVGLEYAECEDCRREDCENEAHGDRASLMGDWVMRFHGRKENSQMPPLLVAHLQDTFTLEKMRQLWRCKKSCRCLGEGIVAVPDEEKTPAHSCDTDPLKIVQCENLDPYPVTLYGEGYGAGIQKGGGGYTSKTKGGAASFRLFDVLVGETWLRRADVEDVAARLGIETVPLIGIADVFGKEYRDEEWDLFHITEAVGRGIPSLVAAEEGTGGHPSEGVVAFTEEPLYNNRGQRLMFKLKTEDFA